MKEKISIIIPCYNVENEIDRLMECLTKQTYGFGDFEVILVDDASTDGTYQRLLHWEQMYEENIMVIHCEKNGKQGTARNIGIDAASGEYISFLDGDDWIVLDYYEILAGIMDGSGSDIVIAGHDRPHTFESYESVGDENKGSKGKNKVRTYTLTDINTRKAFLVDNILATSVCWELYRADFIKQNNLYFPEGIRYEDGPFCYQAYLVADKVTMLDEIMYHYYKNPEGTMRNGSESTQLERLTAMEMFYTKCEQSGYFDGYAEELEFIFLHKYYTEPLEVMFRTFEEIDYGAYCGMKTWIQERFPRILENKYLNSATGDIDKMMYSLALNGFNEEQLEAFRKVYLKKLFGVEKPTHYCSKEEQAETKNPTKCEAAEEKVEADKCEAVGDKVETGNDITRPLVSVIIPCYNAVKYIDFCISALVNQTIGVENMEIILVDDASTDDTMEYLTKWEQRYPSSILVVHCEENGKQGQARNIGMQYANGEYIGFMDDDDYVAPDMYEMLVKSAKENDCDVAIGGSLKVKEADFDVEKYAASYQENTDKSDLQNKGNAEQKSNEAQKTNAEIIDITDKFIRRELLERNLNTAIWNKIYKRELLMENDINFPPGYIYDDIYFSELIKLYCNRIYITEQVFYYHIIRGTSVSFGPKNKADRRGFIEVWLILMEEIIKRGFYEDYRDWYDEEFIISYVTLVTNYRKTFGDLPEDYHRIIKDAIRNIIPDYKNISIVRKILSPGGNEAYRKIIIGLEEN